MLCHKRFLLAVFLSWGLAAAAQSVNITNDPLYCGSVDSSGDMYRSPNSSNSYPVPAVTQSLSPSTHESMAPFGTSQNETWQIINAIGENRTGVELERAIFLDVSSHGPSPATIPPALSGCFFTFRLPSSDNGKSSPNGDCSSLIGQGCVNDIQKNVQALSQSLAVSTQMDIGQACNSIFQSLLTLPKSCPNGGSNPGPNDFGLDISSGKPFVHSNPNHKHKLTTNLTSTASPALNLTYSYSDKYSNCTGKPPQSVYQVYGEEFPHQPGNRTVYDQHASQTTPTLLALFSNGSLYHGTPYANTNLLCTSPTNITNVSPNNPKPTSAAEQGRSVNLNLLVATALVMNVVLCFWL